MTFKWLRLFPLVILMVSTSFLVSAFAQDDKNKPRLIILTDIGGGDTDDEQSLVRFLNYANEFEIEGFIASTDVNSDGETTHPEAIEEIIRLYGDVHDNLVLHDPDYPSAEALLSVVRDGQSRAARWREVTESVGPDKDTPASQHIIDVVDRDDPRPVNIVAWGGSADLAQALWRVREDRSPEELAAFISKIRFYAIADQDSTGPWIRENFPDLFYILNLAPDGQDAFTSVFRGMYREGNTSLVSRDWVNTYVREGHGPLGARYPEDGTGVEGLKEGDTPSFFYFLNNGLQNPAEPSWGGWGGRFQLREGTTHYYQDTEDTLGNDTSRMATVYRWREDYQNDFAARMDWNVLPYDEANHHPEVIVDSEAVFGVDSSEMVTIDASQSTDPDGDALSYDWFYYREPSTFSGSLNLDGVNSAQVAFTAPVVMEAQTVHLILSVTDNGEPALTSYQRFVITIDPLDTSESGSDTAVNGIKGEYFSGQDFGELITTRVDAAIDFNWQEGIPAAGIPQDDFSVRWSGWIVPEYSETYTFYTVADDGIRLYVNGELLVNDWQGGAAREKSGNIRLEAGAHYPILVEYFDNVRAAEATLFWSSDSVAKQVIAPEFYYVPVSEAAQLPEITYILPLGDSITESNGSHNSYRRALWHLLQENDYAVDFVGSQTAHHEGSAPNQDFDMDHEGHWGWRVDEILAQLPGWLEGYTPDVVLMHVGTNDIFQNRSIDETLSDMTEIVEALRADNPEVTLLVAQVIPHNRSDRPALEDFNQAVMGWAESISTPESPAILVDQYTGFDPAQDTFDGVHPNPAGEEKMAQRWYEALEAILPGS